MKHLGYQKWANLRHWIVFGNFWAIGPKSHLITKNLDPSLRRWLGVQFSFVDEKACDEASPLHFCERKRAILPYEMDMETSFSSETKQT